MTYRMLPLFGVITGVTLSACAQLGSNEETPANLNTPVEITEQVTLADAGPSPEKPRVSAAVGKTSFGRAVATAVVSHPDLSSSNALIASASADLESASGAFRPSVSVGANLATSYNTSSDSFDDSSGPYLRISQLIYDGGAARHNKMAAQASTVKARDDRMVSASSTAMAAVEAYLNVLAAQDMLGLVRRNLGTHRRFLNQVEERRRLGAGSESDVLIIRARLADAQTQVADAENSLDQARARYEETFGLVAGTLPRPPQAPTIDRTSEVAIYASPRMRAINSEYDVAVARELQAKAERAPSIEFGSTARQGNGGGADVKFDLSVNYSFDNRREAKAAIDRATAEVARVTAERERLHRDIKRALDFLASDRTAGSKRLRTARAAVAANRKTVDAALEEFTIGRRTLLEVLDAQRDYVRAQQTKVEADREHILTGYQALALTGDIIDAFGIYLAEL